MKRMMSIFESLEAKTKAVAVHTAVCDTCIASTGAAVDVILHARLTNRGFGDSKFQRLSAGSLRELMCFVPDKVYAPDGKVAIINPV
jgi:hypothetical protein